MTVKTFRNPNTSTITIQIDDILGEMTNGVVLSLLRDEIEKAVREDIEIRNVIHDAVRHVALTTNIKEVVEHAVQEIVRVKKEEPDES